MKKIYLSTPNTHLNSKIKLLDKHYTPGTKVN